MDSQPCTLLVVDDDEAIVIELQEFLESCGYHCVGYSSSLEALRRFHEDPDIGIVLCDLHMPELDGIALVQEMERLSSSRAFEAIIFTGQAEPRDVIEAMRAGVADYYQKPIDPEHVLRAVRRLEERLQQRRQDNLELALLNNKLRTLAESIDELYHDINRRRRGPVDHSPQLVECQDMGTQPPFDKLSPRQLEVARLVGKGMTNYQTACELGLTENTVKLYVSQILRLTHMHNRTQLALAMAPPARRAQQVAH
ncbi:DNA-binding response regulator [Pseudomonas taiwanensis]|uniref:response regulator transcription factor n=1 Tax=Pseudomonas taiwanensis TaxID=470150 RepID=UPI0015BD6216|nr:response regulator transcription factor [Pseudomonas taiwanensis]NWL77523.1 DNA-binding response regulator [Pseudomonas taiwanensis]